MRAFPRPKAKGNIFTKTSTIDTTIRESSKKIKKTVYKRLKTCYNNNVSE